MPIFFLTWSAGPKPVHHQAFGPIRTLIIDAGHGGKDPGSVGKLVYEKDITIKVAKKLQQMVNEKMPGVRAVLTRKDDTFIPLHERGKIAQREGGDFFISIHCNGMKYADRHGTETYVLGTNEGQENYERIIQENQSILFEENYLTEYDGFDPNSPEANIFFSLVNNAFRSESFRLADGIQHQYEHSFHRFNRGVKQAPFVVLYMCGMPAVLTEIGFITNPEEEIYLQSEEGQSNIASALFNAVKTYNQGLKTDKSTPGND
ncbi:MAG: N-acetylmuramoyl-L-alanine amidase [Bacteroidota bacterium]